MTTPSGGSRGCVVVTGASGLVGRALCRRLRSDGFRVRGVLRAVGSEALPTGVEPVVVGPIGPGTEWVAALERAEVVIHLAARVHVMRDSAADPLAAFRLVNVAGTEMLAGACARAGVRRLVFVSSVKVNGECTGAVPFRETDTPRPQDAYGRSKWEAEQVLRAVERQTKLDVVVVRPPLVHGPGVRGNLLRLLDAAARGFPLPLGAVRNRRSLVGVDNLCDLIARVMDHPAAAGRTFLVADPDDLATPELCRLLAKCLGRSTRLVPVPVAALEAAAAVVGQRESLRRLVESLQVDTTAARRSLGWTPPVSTEEGIGRMTAWYRESRGLA